MKALILNGSPRGSRSLTGKLLESLAKGLIAGGASIIEFKVASMKIAPCIACMSCMHKKPGVCLLDDEMTPIYERLKVSDLLVLGTPVYTDNMSAQLKAVMDRSVCGLQPFLRRDATGRIRHWYWWRMPAKFMLVSTSGFPERETFDPLIATFRAQAVNSGSDPIAEICVPGAIALQMEPANLAGHLEMIEEFGRQLAVTGEVNPAVLRELNIPPLRPRSTCG